MASSPGSRLRIIVLGYVVEGQVRFAINNEPERIVPTGGTFFEPHGALHTTNEAASPNADAVSWCSPWF